MKKLSKSQERILDFLKERVSEGVPPSVREICAATGLRSTSTVHSHLKALEEMGYITRDEGLNRSIHIVGEERACRYWRSRTSMDIFLILKVSVTAVNCSH